MSLHARTTWTSPSERLEARRQVPPDGGDGAVVSSSVTGDVVTTGDRATGYIAQSLGGGGGNGGLNVTGTLVASGSGAGSVAVGLGGSGGGGGDGRAVTASLTGNLTTLGDDAYGVLFQSVGGGGGNGGMNISSAVSAGNNGAGAVAVGIGGSGGGGGDSAAVIGTVTGNTAMIAVAEITNNRSQSETCCPK